MLLIALKMTKEKPSWTATFSRYFFIHPTMGAHSLNDVDPHLGLLISILHSILHIALDHIELRKMLGFAADSS